MQADSLILEGAPAEAIEQAISALRALDPGDEEVTRAIDHLRFTMGELSTSDLAECADKTLDEVDKDSWDYGGEDGKPAVSDTDSMLRARRLTAFTKRQRN
jgi:hypothetical protein